MLPLCIGAPERVPDKLGPETQLDVSVSAHLSHYGTGTFTTYIPEATFLGDVTSVITSRCTV